MKVSTNVVGNVVIEMDKTQATLLCVLAGETEGRDSRGVKDMCFDLYEKLSDKVDEEGLEFVRESVKITAVIRDR